MCSSTETKHLFDFGRYRPMRCPLLVRFGSSFPVWCYAPSGNDFVRFASRNGSLLSSPSRSASVYSEKITDFGTNLNRCQLSDSTIIIVVTHPLATFNHPFSACKPAVSGFMRQFMAVSHPFRVVSHPFMAVLHPFSAALTLGMAARCAAPERGPSRRSPRYPRPLNHIQDSYQIKYQKSNTFLGSALRHLEQCGTDVVDFPFFLSQELAQRT